MNQETQSNLNHVEKLQKNLDINNNKKHELIAYLSKVVIQLRWFPSCKLDIILSIYIDPFDYRYNFQTLEHTVHVTTVSDVL